MKFRQKHYQFMGSDAIRQKLAGGGAVTNGCTHLGEIQEVSPSADGCEDCLKIGDPWVHLRICLICGHAGCCDNSKNKHATKHFHQTGHPLIQSLEPGESWLWCYTDQALITL
jgi:uncharacterized UBP type Zn finger protein